jgi:hypothetical protein
MPTAWTLRLVGALEQLQRLPPEPTAAEVDTAFRTIATVAIEALSETASTIAAARDTWRKERQRVHRSNRSRHEKDQALARLRRDDREVELLEETIVDRMARLRATLARVTLELDQLQAELEAAAEAIAAVGQLLSAPAPPSAYLH